MLQKLPNSPPPQKTNGPSLTASACVVTAHACALFRPLNFFAITLVFNHSALLHMFSFSESLLYQPLILLSVSFSLSDLTRGWHNSYFLTWVIRDFIIVGGKNRRHLKPWCQSGNKFHLSFVQRHWFHPRWVSTGFIVLRYTGIVFACTCFWIRALGGYKTHLPHFAEGI